MSPPHQALGPGAEFDRIRRIAARLGSGAGALGDDCALIASADGMLAVSTDLSVEGVHFRRDWLSAEEIGWRAAAAALSDLAAEGATPIGLLTGVAVPRETPETELESLMAGVAAAIQSVGGLVLGGDLSRGATWTVCITVFGRVSRPVTRAGALAGDGLWVTGALGAARAALLSWQAGKTPEPGARTAFAHPEPRIQAGQWLARAGARAMIDLSDGLAGDVPHLAAASGCSMEIDLDRLPVSAPAAAWVAHGGGTPGEFAAWGGEDYELLAALPAEFAEADAGRFQRENGLPLTRVGSVGIGSGVIFRSGGSPVALPGAGFDHFA